MGQLLQIADLARNRHKKTAVQAQLSPRLAQNSPREFCPRKRCRSLSYKKVRSFFSEFTCAIVITTSHERQKAEGVIIMALSNLADWNEKKAAADKGAACGTACGAQKSADKPAQKPASACGASEPEKKPVKQAQLATGSACGASKPAEPKPSACGASGK